MKKMICILCGGTNGGTGTLAIRIAKWCLSNDIKMSYCAIENTNCYNTEQLKKYRVNIIFNKTDNTYAKQFGQVVEKARNTIILTYCLSDYYYAERIQKKNDNVKKIILYQVGADGASYVINRTEGIRKIVQCVINTLIFRKYINRIIRNHSYYVIDKQCMDIAKTNLKLNKNIEHLRLHLPYSVTFYKKPLEKYISIPVRFHITTVCRMSFPFKGYVLGLVDIFEELVKDGYNIELTIIGDGDDMPILRERIDSLSKSILCRIHVTGALSYEKTKNIIRESTLYIGMGTTIFDAADSFTLAMPVAFDTYTIEANCLFYDNPHDFAIDVGSGSSEFVRNKIIEMYTLSDSEYIDSAIVQYELLKKYYDTSEFMSCLIKQDINSGVSKKKKAPIGYRLFNRGKWLKAIYLNRKEGSKQ